MIHEILLERRTLHGHFSRDLQPVLAVKAGDSVAFRALMAGWRWEPTHEFFEERDPRLDSGHALVGPVEVRGARAGGTLAVTIDEVVAGRWGVTFGFDEDLDRAASLAVEAMLDLIERELSTDRKHALAVASVVVDVRVTQLVNGVRGVHAVLPHDAVRIATMPAS